MKPESRKKNATPISHSPKRCTLQRERHVRRQAGSKMVDENVEGREEANGGERVQRLAQYPAQFRFSSLRLSSSKGRNLFGPMHWLPGAS